MRRQILSRGLLTVAAASGILAVTGGYASADSDAQSGSNEPRHSADDHSPDAHSSDADSQQGESAGDGYAGAVAEGSAKGSAGVLSGNSVNVPISAPVNICGNSVDAAALLNAVSGNSCANGEAPPTPVVPGPRHAKPPAPHVNPPVAPPTTPEVQLADTGASRGAVGAATGAGAALLLGGTMIYRRSTRIARIRRTYS